ncbi:MAG TPA: DUF2855 family protein [Polyangiales bacterium]|nr:DUF2855 family protein [Polyangiales bacterium]
MTKRLLHDKAQLARFKLAERDEQPLADGEALLAIDRLALTTNNITYALLGDAMQYWQYFPSGEPGWGVLPAWGFANVVASNTENVQPGERFYGYLPLATQLRVQPTRVSPRGFVDGAPHRASLVAPYNQYTRCSPEHARSENLQALLRPLLGTGLFAADFLLDNAFFGARRVLVSSASSKTAYSTAYCLRRESDIELVALTSNRQFVEQLGCYSRVVAYDQPLEADVPTLYLDFSGDPALRERVHQQTQLVYDCAVGFTKGGIAAPRAFSEPAPVFFFVFDQIKKRSAEWGPQELARRMAEAQQAFLADAQIEVVEHQGLEAAAALIAELAQGRVDPHLGHVLLVAQ